MIRTLVLALAVGFAGLVAPFSASAAVARASSGSVSAELTYTRDAEGEPVTLRITRGTASATFDGLERSDDEWAPWSAMEYQGPLIVDDLDGDLEPEIIVRLYSGGAHCCERTAIASLSADGTYRLDIHDWGDASWRLVDLNYDDRVEFVSWDARWAYWGSSFAESPSPLQIWSFRGGTLMDASAEHPGEVLLDMARQWSIYRRRAADGMTGKGNLAAYLADAYVAGRQEKAWKRIYRAYQEPDRTRFFTALRRRLTDLGYRVPGSHVLAIPPPRRPGAWHSCRSRIPEFGFIAGLQARGIPCRLARQIAKELGPPGPGLISRFRCRHREVAIETVRIRCVRGLSEGVRFYTGV